MEEKINTASQKSPVSPEVSDEVTVSENVGGSSATDSETIMTKRKRGRPKKQETNDHAGQSSSLKRPRGRPKGSGKLQRLASIGGIFAETAGGDFCPYALFIKPGEDLARTIISFATIPRRAVCILAATGTVSKVFMRLFGSSTAKWVDEGGFQIVTLSGSYRYDKVDNKLKVMGQSTITLASADGKVIGGSIAGSIIAESRIQLIIATFKQNVISGFLKRKRSSSAVARVSVRNKSKVAADYNENSTAPETVPLEQQSPIAAVPLSFVAVNENPSTPASPQSFDENYALQVWQPSYDQNTSFGTAAAQNEKSNPASP